MFRFNTMYIFPIYFLNKYLKFSEISFSYTYFSNTFQKKEHYSKHERKTCFGNVLSNYLPIDPKLHEKKQMIIKMFTQLYKHCYECAIIKAQTLHYYSKHKLISLQGHLICKRDLPGVQVDQENCGYPVNKHSLWFHK